MKQPKIDLERVRHHFTYSWWVYALCAGLLVFFWSYSYNATRYVPPAEKTVTVNFMGSYVGDDLLDDLTAMGEEAFPEMELIEVMATTLSADDSQGAYAAQQRMMVMVAAGEGDVFMVDRSLFQGYANMGAFQPLDDMLSEGGALEGMFTEEEIAQGTLTTEPGSDEDTTLYGTHCYGLPATRFYAYYDYGVDPRDYFLVRTSYTRNPEYADRMLLLMAQQGMGAERPSWLDETAEREQQAQDEAAQYAPIG